MGNAHEFRIEYRDVRALIPYINNPKDHPESQIKRLAGAIREFGFLVPVVIDSKNTIAAGHGRVLAAERLGLKKIPTILADHLTSAQIKAYRLADNKIGESDWLDDILAVEIQELQELDFDLDMIGFDEKEIAEILREPSGIGTGGEPDPNPDSGLKQFAVLLTEDQYVRAADALHDLADEHGDYDPENESRNGNAFMWLIDQFREGL